MASHGPSGWSWAKADLHGHTRLKVDGSRVHAAVWSVNGPPYVLIHCVTCASRANLTNPTQYSSKRPPPPEYARANAIAARARAPP